MKKWIFLLIPIALLFLVCAKAENTAAPGDSSDAAPAFELTDLNGSTIILGELKGKVVFLNFWATWCPPCKEEIPGFVEAYAQYKDEGLAIIGVSLDRISQQKVLEFTEEYEINYPVAMSTQQLYDDYQPGQFIPATIVIDRQGLIRHRHVGYMDKETLVKYFQELSQE